MFYGLLTFYVDINFHTTIFFIYHLLKYIYVLN